MINITLTGHRSKRLRGKEQEVFTWVKNLIKILGEGQDRIVCYCGCAEGADEIFGYATIASPNTYLVLCKPVCGYREKEINILGSQAKESIAISEKWHSQADQFRDKYMVEHCDILLAIWDGIKNGGVWSTIKYAKKLNKPIIFFPKEILLNK